MRKPADLADSNETTLFNYAVQNAEESDISLIKTENNYQLTIVDKWECASIHMTKDELRDFYNAARQLCATIWGEF